jgi:ankyrin repeat protein
MRLAANPTDGQLHIAAGRGRIDAVRFLLQSGAFVNKQNSDGYTPLWYYLNYLRDPELKPDMEMFHLLVQHGADLNDPGPPTPLLCVAMKFRDDSLISYLVESGADVHRRATDGSTLPHHIFSFHTSASFGGHSGSYAVAKLAEPGVDLEARNTSGHTALIHGLDHYPSPEAWETLARLPVDLNVRDDRGWTILHILSAQRSPWLECAQVFG